MKLVGYSAETYKKTKVGITKNNWNYERKCSIFKLLLQKNIIMKILLI